MLEGQTVWAWVIRGGIGWDWPTAEELLRDGIEIASNRPLIISGGPDVPARLSKRGLLVRPARSGVYRCADGQGAFYVAMDGRIVDVQTVATPPVSRELWPSEYVLRELVRN